MTALTIVLTILGAPTVISQLNGSASGGGKVVPITCKANDQTCLQLNPTSFVSASNNWLLGAMLVVLAAAGILANLLLGFSAIYVLPIVIIIALMNFFVLPYGIFINPAIIDPSLGIIIIFLLNVFQALAVADFVRGGA